ncbi:MAG TPA: tyrosine-type recombinase/integrase [Thermoanaerobaculia bacterium]|nr:tyrosine-type recombinase/integrase [Thermoanaerobaculia bacterium]
MRGKSKANHHLFLRGGIWWTRFERNGREICQSTRCPKSEVATARQIRNERKARIAQAREGVEIPCSPLALGELLAAYIETEGQPYDRGRGGEQPGTKRSPDTLRTASKAILRHLSPELSAVRVNRETLLDLAERRERENPTPAPLSRRNTFATLRRVYSWAAARPSRTGITRSPFDTLTREDRKRLFPRGKKRAYIYGAEQLRAIYDRLPSYEVPFVRFAVHTGMRLREITTLTWGNVDLDGRKAYVEARFAKFAKARDVALGEVALSILSAIRPADPAPGDHVFLGKGGRPIRDVRGGFDPSVLAVWKASRPEERKPRFHDLRKTAATRVEAVSSHAVAKVFLGHSDENVTDSYIQASLDDVRDAVNRAARSIDGQIPPGTIAFPERTVTKAVTPPAERIEIGERSVSNPHG